MQLFIHFINQCKRFVRFILMNTETHACEPLNYEYLIYSLPLVLSTYSSQCSYLFRYGFSVSTGAYRLCIQWYPGPIPNTGDRNLAAACSL